MFLLRVEIRVNDGFWGVMHGLLVDEVIRLLGFVAVILYCRFGYLI